MGAYTGTEGSRNTTTGRYTEFDCGHENLRNVRCLAASGTKTRSEFDAAVSTEWNGYVSRHLVMFI